MKLIRHLPLLAAALAAASVCCAPAAAATAPSALTGPVSTVSGSGATVNGTVNPNGTATTWYFEYGTSTSYGSQTSSQSAGAGSSNTAVSASLSGLTPGTTYHYRLDATSSAGTSEGSDGIFTTAAAPAVATGAATGLTASSATLTGTVDPNGEQTSWYFQYGKTTSYGSQTATTAAGAGSSPLSISAALSGLSAGQTYHFRLVAISAAGTTDGADESFSLSAAPTVTTAAATGVSSTAAKLNGSVDPNGEQTTWYFEYGKTTSYGAQTPAASAGAGTQALAVTASLAGLAPGSTYHYRMVASNASGTSFGADKSFADIPPPVVQTGSAQGTAATSVTLTAAVNPEGGATSWHFQYGTTTAYGSTSASQSAGSGTAPRSVSALVSGLKPDTTYHYRVVASNPSGTSEGGDVTFTTPLALTLGAETSQTVYGRADTLSGTLAGAGAGVKVTVLGEALGQTSFTSLGTVATGSGGSWSYAVRPGIQTSYEASAGAARSAPLTVGVRPAVTIRIITGARFLVTVAGPVSWAGRLVELQRLDSSGAWRTLARARLGPRSTVRLAARLLPLGSSTIRIAMSVNEAGRGYLAGFSRTLVFTRS